MQTKSLNFTLSLFSDSSRASDSAAPAALYECKSAVSSFSVLSERRAMLQACQTGLSQLFDGHTGAVQAGLTHSVVDAKLREAARLTAEILEYAECAADHSSSAQLGSLGTTGMRKLADACFDGILCVDAARQDLGASFQADPAFQRVHRNNALRVAREVVMGIESKLAKLLAD